MRRITRIPKRKLVVGAAFAAVGLVVGGVAYSAIPASDGTITACYNPLGGSGGALRVIDTESDEACKTNETELTWNQQGEQGPPGPAGKPGADGQDGEPGMSGYEITLSGIVDVPPGEQQQVIASCPDGKVATGGGFSLSSSNLVVDASVTSSDGGGWIVVVRNEATLSSASAEAQAICVSVNA